MIRFFTMLLLLAAPFARADSQANKLMLAGITEFTNAYEAWDGARFLAAAELFRQATTNASPTATNFYWLGTAQFHRLLQLQNDPGASTNEAAAGVAMEAALESLTTAVKLDEHHAESHALLGTLYGMKISGNVLRAVWLGPRVQKHRELALATGAKNPRVQYLLGTCQFHTSTKPAAWRETLETLLTAEKLFEAEARLPAAPLDPRWGHDSCLTFIGWTCEKLGRLPEAAEYFRKALAMHPQDSFAQAGLKRVTKDKE
jgi:tetratricopeptide (TPR) repeat protein